jgi:glycosyltransferase involved in cell wall biosynthesis
MATYNGARFVEVQLESILRQLGPQDEVVIVDDASVDDTVEVIKQYGDTRIILYKNESNLGPAMTFNRALQLARGDIIFLSDQDDRWYDDKVSVVVNIMTEKKYDLIVHDAVVVRGGIVISKSLFESSGSGSGVLKNVISNTYTGCCMAFRRSMLEKILPISSNIGLYHDAWIGVMARLYGYKDYFLNMPLIEFVRHDKNASTLSRRKISDIIYDRLRFVSAIVYHIIRKRLVDNDKRC